MQTRFNVFIWLISGALIALSGLFLVLSQGQDVSKNSQSGLILLTGLTLVSNALLIWQRRHIARLLSDVSHDGMALWRYARSGFQYWRNNTTGSHWFILIIIICAGIGLRLLFIHQPIRTDESLTYLQFASKPLYLALSDYSAPNNHLLHTFGVWITTRIFGDAEWSIRLTALIMGVLSIPLTYITGRLHSNARTGLIAAALVAVSSVLIEYSTNARGYTLQTALFLAAVIMAYIALKSRRLTAFILLGALLASGFYTVPTMLYGAGGLMLWLGFSILTDDQSSARKRQLGRWLIAGVVTASLTIIAYAPVIIVSGFSSITGNIYVQPLSLTEYMSQLPDFLAGLITHWHNGISIIIIIGLIVGHIISLFRHSSALRYRLPLLIVLIGWSALVIVIQRVLPFYRVWLPFLPVYFIVGTAGLVYLTSRIDRSRQIVTAGMLALILISGSLTIITTRSPYWSTETGTFRDAVAVIETLQDTVETNADFRVIYEHPSGESLRYYASRFDLPLAWIQRDFTLHDVLYVVVNTEYPQSVESVMRLNNQAISAYGTPEQIASYPQAELYRVERRD